MQQYHISQRATNFQQVMENTVCTKDGKTLALESGKHDVMRALMQTTAQGGAVYLVGNGGSAAVASHALTDFLNVCKIRAHVLHDAGLITCLANDFGYDQAYKRALQTVFKPGDLLIAISSSGKSANICNAAKAASECLGQVITLTGFQSDNPLRQLGDYNFWLDSSDYGLVEIGHLFLLHNFADSIAHQAQSANAAVACAVSG